MEFIHKSVLLDEAVNALRIKPDGVYVDGTVGGAGHSSEIAKRLTTGRLISLDKDPDALAVASERLARYPQATVIESDFCSFDRVLDNLGIDKADGILLDLGVSSYQLDTAERGFSYHSDAPLDMRMSKQGMSAGDVVNDWPVEELTRIFREYADEKFAYKIARAIESHRSQTRIETTLQLADIVRGAVPAAARRDGHPARKAFQAIRIAVNGELDSLSEFLEKAIDRVNVGGVVAIITFHSLEDRMVKHRFAEWCRGCTCPPDFPVCVCGKKPKAEPEFKKPIVPTDAQMLENARTRSAKLRAVIKI
jgi:16S rRNA (cytosine1402-N4)-methyltransferase